jgi:hypothetical protein
VAVEPGSLTFQQRHAVQVRTTYPVKKLMKAGISISDIHVIARFATEDGRLLPGQCYTQLQLPTDGPVPDTIDSFASVYLRPGRYNFAVMAYDVEHRNGSLLKGSFEVRREKHDPLPDTDADLPLIDYPSPIPLIKGGETSVVHSWALGRGHLRLPVANPHPIELDVVVNLTPSAFGLERLHDQVAIAFLMQISNVLTQLDLRQGCVRFSAIDILRQQTFALGVEGRAVDWDGLAAALAKINPLTIDAGALAGQRAAAARFRDFLQQATTAPDTCSENGKSPQHVLIVLSDDFVFQPETEKAIIDPRVLPPIQCYYLELGLISVVKDDMDKLLRPLHPERIAFVHPLQFRKALAQIITSLEKSN